MALTHTAVTTKQSIGPLRLAFGSFTGSADLSLVITQAEHGMSAVDMVTAMASVAANYIVAVNSSTLAVTITFSANQTSDGQWMIIGRG